MTLRCILIKISQLMYCNVVQHKLLVQVRNIQILLLLTAQQEKNTPRQKSGEYNV